jgi:hypothetical protein
LELKLRIRTKQDKLQRIIYVYKNFTPLNDFWKKAELVQTLFFDSLASVFRVSWIY